MFVSHGVLTFDAVGYDPELEVYLSTQLLAWAETQVHLP